MADRFRPQTTAIMTHSSQLQDSFTQLRSGRSQDVVHRDSLGTNALHQGLATESMGCIRTECQVMGSRHFYRAMHPYGGRGLAIGSSSRSPASRVQAWEPCWLPMLAV